MVSPQIRRGAPLTRTVGQLPDVVREVESRWIALMDGCRLAARVWLPPGAQGPPGPGAVVSYTKER